MKSTRTSSFPAPPSLVSSFLGGFDTAANRAGLLLFPLTLDLLIWLGPALRVRQLINRFSELMFSVSASTALQPAESVEAARQVWTVFAERMNLWIALRTYPVGIPSLMAGRLPAGKPELISASGFEISTWGGAFVLWVLLSITGLIFGSLYSVAVASTAVPQAEQRTAFKDALWITGQIFLLTILLLVLLAAATVPVFCILTVVVFVNPALGNFAALLVMGGLVWFFLPLFFAPHGVIIYRVRAWEAIRRSLRLTRTTLPSTGLFFLSALLLSQGMDLLWRVPAENSWLTLVGLFGHAFITTALLAASFIYYQQADHFTQRMRSYWSEVRMQA
jgi:hypothetical protein